MKKLLVIAGPLSGYSLDLLHSVAHIWPCSVHVIHEPLPVSVGFSHERLQFDDIDCLDWTKATHLDIVRFVQGCRPDAVIVHGTRPARAIVLALGVLSRSVPKLFVSDANIYELVSRRGRLLPRLAVYAALFSQIPVALSLGLSNELALRLLGAPTVRWLPMCAVDYAMFDRERERTVSSGPNKRYHLAIIARHIHVKNLPAAIDAVSSDPELRDSVTLSFVGDGPLRRQLEALAAKRGVDAKFCGALPRAEVGRYLASADALLLPSTKESWGIVVCEALGMGIPVIASPAVGAATSLAGQSQAIVVARSASETDLAEAIREFVANSDRLTDAARMAAPKIRQLYSLPEVAKRLARLLEDLSCVNLAPT